MIKFLTGYATGNVLFDRVSDVCVGVIVATVAAMIAWYVRDHIHYGND
jgi:hypothetical protein